MFSFLDAMICTLGALLVLLHAFARHGDEHVSEKVAAHRAEILAEQQTELEDARWRIEQLKDARAKTEAQLADERLKLSHVEDHQRRLLERLDQLKIAANELGRLNSTSAQQREKNLADLAATQARAAEAKQALEEARKNAKKQGSAYSVVPYEGPNSTHRRPIYIECRGNSVILQPEGIELAPSDFAGFIGPGNPLAAALRGIREYYARQAPPGQTPPEPYPLMLVRPEGIEAYYAARAALDSWGSDFGYELVGADWKLSFPEPDRQLTALTERVVSEARVRQQEYQALSPQLARGRSRPTFHANSRGGFSPDKNSGGGGRGGDGSGSGWDSLGSNWAKRGAASGSADDPSGTGAGGDGSGDPMGGAAGAGGVAGTGLGGTAGGPNGTGGPNGMGGGMPGGTSNTGGLTGTPGTGPGGTGAAPGGTGNGTGTGDSLLASGSGSGDPRYAPGGRYANAAGSGRYGQGGSGSQSGRGGNGNSATAGNGGSNPDGSPGGDDSEGNGNGNQGQVGSDTSRGSQSNRYGRFASTGGAAGGSSTQQGTGSSGSGGNGQGSSSSGQSGGQSGSQSGGQSGSGSDSGASGSSSNVMAGSPQNNMTPPGKKVQSMAKSRGRDWGLPESSVAAVGASRPVLVECHNDRLVIPSEQPNVPPKEIRLGPNAQDSMDELVTSVWHHMKGWGTAGKGLYWKPTLVMQIEPGAADRYAEIKALLADSGMEVRERQPQAAHKSPAAKKNTTRK